MKLPIFFLIIIVVGGTATGRVIVRDLLTQDPHILHIQTTSIGPNLSDLTGVIGGVLPVYVNERHDFSYPTYTSNARKFCVTINSFSDGLQILAWPNKSVQSAPYVLIDTSVMEDYVLWGFAIITPSNPGTYRLQLSIKLSNWFSSKEYKAEYTFEVNLVTSKPTPEELLVITLDREVYHEGDVMTITLKNVSNETIWFTNGAYNLIFEKFKGGGWELYITPVASAVMTALEPGEASQLTWALDAHLFPHGRYRVGTHGVSVEFEVVDVSARKIGFPPKPEESPAPTKEETSPSEPISQNEAIAIVKARARTENIRIDEMELRPLTRDEISLIQELCSIAGVEKEPPELVWIACITELFIDVGPRSAVIILDAYTGEIVYGFFHD